MTQHEMVRLIDGSYLLVSSRVVDGELMMWTQRIEADDAPDVLAELQAYSVPTMP